MKRTLYRRDFLRLMAGSVGGVMLTSSLGCNGGGGDSLVPNGYKFFRIKNLGELTGADDTYLRINSFGGAAHLSDNGLVTFDAIDAEGNDGIFQLGLSFDQPAPLVVWERPALVKGQTLTDGRVVAGYRAMDVNLAGALAVVVDSHKAMLPQHYGSGLYLEENQQGLQPVMVQGASFAGEALSSNGIIGDVDLHEGNDILLVANYSTEDPEFLAGEALVHLPGASLEASELLLATGDYLGATENAIASFGLVDRHDGGHYAVQTRATNQIVSTNQAGEDYLSGGLLLTGNVATSGANGYLASTPDLGLGYHQGDTDYGPRMAPDGVPYGVIQDEAAADSETETTEPMRLVRGEQVVLATGWDSPAGGRVAGLHPGAVNKEGTLYYVLNSDESAYGHALMSFNGAEHSMLLAYGDVLADGGSPVEYIAFGTTTQHVDSEDRLVLICTFADGTMSLVIGIPA